MYNPLKIITDLFKGFPFWFGAGSKRDKPSIDSDWKYLTDNHQWHLRTDKKTGKITYWYKGTGTKVIGNTLWVNLN